MCCATMVVYRVIRRIFVFFFAFFLFFAFHSTQHCLQQQYTRGHAHDDTYDSGQIGHGDGDGNGQGAAVFVRHVGV